MKILVAAGLSTFLAAGAISACFQNSGKGVPFSASPVSVPAALKENSKWSILIDKSDRNLYLVWDGKVEATYPVVFGSDPVSDKRMEGDSRTPEGLFSIRDLYPHKSWTFFLWIDYPTEESWKKHKEAKRKGEIPESASIGGEIGIHGVPEGRDTWIDEKTDWTLGCISLKNEHIRKVYEKAFKGMQVLIRP